MDTYMHKTMASIVSLTNIEIIRSQEFMASEARLKFLKIMIILGPKTAILGPQFCRILVLGPHFWWSGGARAPGPPGSAPVLNGVFPLHAYSIQVVSSHQPYGIPSVPQFTAWCIVTFTFCVLGLIVLIVTFHSKW